MNSLIAFRATEGSEHTEDASSWSSKFKHIELPFMHKLLSQDPRIEAINNDTWFWRKKQTLKLIEEIKFSR